MKEKLKIKKKTIVELSASEQTAIAGGALITTSYFVCTGPACCLTIIAGAGDCTKTAIDCPQTDLNSGSNF